MGTKDNIETEITEAPTITTEAITIRDMTEARATTNHIVETEITNAPITTDANTAKDMTKTTPEVIAETEGTEASTITDITTTTDITEDNTTTEEIVKTDVTEAPTTTEAITTIDITEASTTTDANVETEITEASITIEAITSTDMTKASTDIDAIHEAEVTKAIFATGLSQTSTKTAVITEKEIAKIPVRDEDITITENNDISTTNDVITIDEAITTTNIPKFASTAEHYTIITEKMTEAEDTNDALTAPVEIPDTPASTLNLVSHYNPQFKSQDQEKTLPEETAPFQLNEGSRNLLVSIANNDFSPPRDVVFPKPVLPSVLMPDTESLPRFRTEQSVTRVETRIKP